MNRYRSVQKIKDGHVICELQQKFLWFWIGLLWSGDFRPEQLHSTVQVIEGTRSFEFNGKVYNGQAAVN